MSRKKAREIALHIIFELGFRDFQADDLVIDRLNKENMKSFGKDVSLYENTLTNGQAAYITEVVNGVALHKDELDHLIEKNSHDWSMSRLSRMTLSILRLALYEIGYVEDVPTGVAINEAVELAKTYESDETGTFINGVLGAIGREQEHVQ